MIASIPDAAAMFNCNVKLVGAPDYTYSVIYAAINPPSHQNQTDS